MQAQAIGVCDTAPIADIKSGPAWSLLAFLLLQRKVVALAGQPRVVVVHNPLPRPRTSAVAVLTNTAAVKVRRAPRLRLGADPSIHGHFFLAAAAAGDGPRRGQCAEPGGARVDGGRPRDGPRLV